MSATFVNSGIGRYVDNMYAARQPKDRTFASISSNVNKSLGVADDFFRLPDYALAFSKQFSDNPNLPVIHGQVLLGRSLISAARCLPTAAYFISGQVFKDSWTDKVLHIILAIARFLSPFAWLHKLKAIDLGGHAKWIGYTIMGAFTAVGIGSFICELKDWSHLNTLLHGDAHNPNANIDKMREAIKQKFKCDDADAQKILMNELDNRCGAVVSEALEVGCAPWENGIVLSNNFAFVIVGAVLNFISAAYKLMRI